jgi:hypothetical protein
MILYAVMVIRLPAVTYYSNDMQLGCILNDASKPNVCQIASQDSPLLVRLADCGECFACYDSSKAMLRCLCTVCLCTNSFGVLICGIGSVHTCSSSL